MSISFSKNDNDKRHFNSLKINVRESIKKTPTNRIWIAQFKAIIFPLFYITLYIISLLFIGNIMMFKSKSWQVYSADMCGGGEISRPCFFFLHDCDL